MRTSSHRWAVLLITGAIWVPEVSATDPKPDLPVGTAKVLYRGKTHTLTGKDAAPLCQAALGLLETSCKETGGVYEDGDVQRRYQRAQQRSHVLVTFARPVDVPKAGNNKIPVRVESVMIPFSPDLDPETVYVLPGKRGERAFTRFLPDPCDAIREALVKAGIYPADSK
jgi:hypothetical protein